MEGVAIGVIGFAGLLACASLLVPLAHRLRIPHAVLLAALGMGLGLASAFTGLAAHLGPVADVLRGLAHLQVEAETLLVVFLPALLFTAGLGIDTRRLLDEFAAVLLLAVVAVVVCTGVVGLALSPFAYVPTVACFLLGAIVATTDPAAVIGVFRDLGAPRRLTVLVEGESLFNDAAAIAIFTILMEMLLGAREPNAVAGISAFLRDFLGGAVVGLAMGRAAAWTMGRIARENIARITITVALAYLSFVVADTYLDVSGVVAVVVASLTMAGQGPVIMGRREWRSLVEVWHHLEFWANSFIFVLAALLAGRLMAELEWRDLGLLSVIVGAALGARAAVLFGLLPGLGALGLVAPVEGKFKTVIVWGGLRGAVTLALALAVAENDAVPPDVRHFVGVLATGFVLFTLFVSAPTLRTLLALLGLDKLGTVERAVRDRVVAMSQTTIREEARAFAADSGLDPGLVDKLSLCSPDEEGAEPRLSAAERLQVGLVTLATREKSLYLDSGLERAASRRLVAILSSAADRLVDQARTSGVDGYEEGAQRMLAFTRAFRVAHWIYRRFGFSTPLARAIADRYELLLVVQLVLRELDRAIRGSIRNLLGQETSAALAPLLEVRRVAVRDALAAISLQYPAYAEALRSQYLQRSALRIEEADYERWREESLISPEVHEDLARAIDARREALDRRPPLDLGLRLSEMMRRVPALSELPAERVNDIVRMLRPRLAVPGEAIIRKGERGDAMYFVASGEVEVHLPHAPVRLATGEFFGEMALLEARPRNADVHAVGFCHLLALGASDFLRALRGHPELWERIRTTAEARRAATPSG